MRTVVAIFIFAIAGLSFFCTTRASAAEVGAVRMAHLTIKPGMIDAFKEAVREEMRDALRLEPGVVAIYAISDKADPARITFFEMYIDEEAYQLHRQTAHFKKYFETTKDMIAERVLLEGEPMELRDKHNTPLESKEYGD